jgi:acetyl esterase/lipase
MSAGLARLHHSSHAAGDVSPPNTGGPYREVSAGTNITYTADGSQLDVFKPTGAPPPAGGFPAIIALAGGGWRHANRKDYGGIVADTFGSYGYVVLPTDYAYASPNGGSGTWPRAVIDVRDAVRWVRKHAASLDVNPDKIVISGESSGAHLAALAGTLDSGGFDPGNGKLIDNKSISGKPDAVIDFFGPSDLMAEWNQRPNVRPYLLGFLGGSSVQVPGRYVAASPLDHVSPDDPPTYLIQGTADKVVIPESTIAFDQALKDAGVMEQLTFLNGIPHGFRFHVGARDLGAEVRAFLDRVWAQPAV